MKSTIKLSALLITLLISSCTDATMAKIGGLGEEFKIEMINCDGTVAREWISTGKVKSEQTSDGYFFMDKKSRKLIEVTGRIVITKL